MVVTDSPLLLSLVYNNDFTLGEEFNQLVRKVFGSYNSKNYYLKRTKDYNPVGRFQTEDESDKIGDKIFNLLQRENISFTETTGDIEGYDKINTINIKNCPLLTGYRDKYGNIVYLNTYGEEK